MGERIRRDGRPWRVRRGRPSNLGDPCFSSMVSGPWRAGNPSPARHVYTGAHVAGSEKRPYRGRPPARGTGAAADGSEEVGGLHTSDDAGELVGNSDPAERRRPVWRRASGGKHERCIDIERHVTGTAEGSGKSAARARRTVPLTGTLDRRASSGAGLSAHPQGCVGGCGWGHEGAVRAGPGE
jgi:hypothetical protein